MAPPTRDDKLERCDLVGVARVISAERASAEAPNLVRLAFVRVDNGAPRAEGGFVDVRRRGGELWSDWWDYPIGALVLTHLAWNAPERVYETAWPGAVSDAEEKAEVA